MYINICIVRFHELVVFLLSLVSLSKYAHCRFEARLIASKNLSKC